ncbi:MAG: hypothetical protein R3245_11450, partial [Kiloniellales bacterium]|nr:hypothetical protein [Kiloniellales bacterium]
ARGTLFCEKKLSSDGREAGGKAKGRPQRSQRRESVASPSEESRSRRMSGKESRCYFAQTPRAGHPSGQGFVA